MADNSKSNLDTTKSINKKDSFYEGSFFIYFLKVFLNILIIVLLIGGISFAGYYLYINIPGEPQNLKVNFKEDFENYSTNDSLNYSEVVEQFYANMKFNHNIISYKINEDCRYEKRERMIEAFNKLSLRVKEIKFIEDNDDPDIEVSCSKRKIKTDKDHFIAGEGGAKEIIQTGRYNIITEGVVLLYDNHHFGSLDCDWSNVEIHELLHVFGFEHSENPKSIMYPYLDSCEQKIDESIILELKRLYSQENLPDLYFEDLEAIKRGIYLDFNLTIRNSGSVDAKNVSFSVLDEGELVKTNEVDDLKYGSGILIKIKNFKLLNRDSKKIEFVLDKDNNIKEINEKNNKAKLSL